MILLIDNYDSFTYNLKQYLLELGQQVEVVRNDSLTIAEIENINPSHIIISPGPGRPEEAGISIEVIKKFSGQIPILGVCLGHQAIAAAFGGEIVSAGKLMHGKTSKINHDSQGIFSGLPNDFVATRYHSLVIKKESCPLELKITATSEDQEIMAIKHKEHLTEGVQFHPESILTLQGKNILRNFLAYEYTVQNNNQIIKEALKKITRRENLTVENAQELMTEIMSGQATLAQIGAILASLSMKGESIEEITAFARVMREKSVKIIPQVGELLDTCGTGGDNSGTFNISTAVAFVVAGAGIKVAKHGNRSMTSKSGSADLLEALGVKIDLTPKQVAKSIEEVGLGFMFAPKLHPAMKHAIGPRKELGIRTVFNILGPLTNPASADYQLLGVYSQDLVEKIAGVLKNLGLKKAYVVASDDGLDEISISSPTLIAKLIGDEINISKFDPKDFGYQYDNLSALQGGDALYNAEIVKKIFANEPGAPKDIVAINAAFAITLGKNIPLEEGLKLAEESISSGQAKKVLTKLIDFTNS